MRVRGARQAEPRSIRARFERNPRRGRDEEILGRAGTGSKVHNKLHDKVHDKVHNKVHDRVRN